ncbi:DUF423 domain-containing protein [Gallibacterium melopsittaci]|uniref:DUF423 domain-containing protein n=1 Tax=Gallibacterium melopsittaci TaxID=516063 RepID=A0ABV6HWN1_9PAST
MFKPFLIFTALSGFFCVAFGAFSSHVLSKQLSAEALNWLEVGWRYQTFHTLALLFLILLFVIPLPQVTPKWYKTVKWTGYCWIAGIILFSFSLYCLALTGNKSLAHLTPIGGVFFLLGWGNLCYLGIRYRFLTHSSK